MKTINIREARLGLAKLFDDAQKEPICITRHGKPVVLVTGVEGADLGSVILEGSKEFWQEIERRRASKAPRRTIEQVRADLGVPSRSRAKRAG